MEIPRSAARELTSVANIAMSARAEQWPFAARELTSVAGSADCAGSFQPQLIVTLI